MIHGPSRLRLCLGALAGVLILLGTLTATASAAEWGELGFFSLHVGRGPGEVDGTKDEASFAAAPDGEYFVGEESQAGTGGASEYRIQHFVGSTVQGEPVSFSGKQKVQKTGVLGLPGEVEGSGPVLLAVDSAHHRVYALETFRRREADEEEEEKEEKTGKRDFPLDDGQPAAGALYGFEYTPTEIKPLNGGAPLLDAEQLKLQGETTAGEPILNPRGIAIDPRGGDVVVAASEDIEVNTKVEKEESEKQCRPLIEYLVPSESGGVVTGAAIGHRFDDRGAVMANNGAAGGEDPCGEKEEEAAYERTPLSPVVTPQGRVLVYFDDSHEEGVEVGEEGLGQIWEVAAPKGEPPTTANAAKPGTTTAEPRKLYDEVPSEAEELAPAGEAVGVSEMSLVEGSSSEAALYVNAIYTHSSGSTGAPFVFHLLEPSKPTEPAKLTEVGFTAGAEVVDGAVAPKCGIWDQERSLAQIVGLTGGKYLAFSQFELGSAHDVEVKEFGEGGSTAGCPAEPTLSPVVTDSEHPGGTSAVPVGEPTTIEEEIASIVSGSTVKEAGRARSVEWTIKYHLLDGEEGVEHAVVNYPEPKSAIIELPHTFAKAGTYEISAAITTTDLGHPAAQVSAADVIQAEVSKLGVQMLNPSPSTIPAQEGDVTLEAEVEAPVVGEKFLVTNVTWKFGDGSQPVVENLEGSPLAIEGKAKVKALMRAFNRCATSTCSVQVEVEGHGEKSGVSYAGSAKKLVTVTESKAEAEAREARERKEREAEEAARKAREAEEAQHKAEAEAAQHKAEAEAAQHKAEEEAAAKKHQEEEAAAKKRQEEEAAKKNVLGSQSKTPTRAQLLAKALKTCKKEPKKKRAKCEATAKKKYGPKKKIKKKKKK